MPNASHPFTALLQKRVVVLDGAMGTTLQRLGLSEADYRGERFRNWKGKDLKGAIELLLLTKPEAVEHVHEDYLRAGADVIETNTFSATTIGLQEFLFDGKPNNGRKDPEFFERDRKSTRLNSSHSSISYAVFCLKKKKINKKNMDYLDLQH